MVQVPPNLLAPLDADRVLALSQETVMKPVHFE